MDEETELKLLKRAIKLYGCGIEEHIKLFLTRYKVECLQRGNFCMVKIFDSLDPSICGFGFSKRNPIDKFDNEIGKSIAFRRAANKYISIIAASK